jgi:N-acyl-D-amino-acid deacylase
MQKINPAKSISSCVILLFCFIHLHAQTIPDMAITNARILDGTGNSWYWGALTVSNGKIAQIIKGRFTPNIKAKQNIDAKGMLLAPGFIDVHAHIEGGIFERPTADNYIYDGVTTVVTGNCGGSADNIAQFLGKIDSVKTSINVATLIGHNTVRRQGMGLEDKQATPDEMKKMESLVDKAMKDGAVGLSTGLIYLPGMYANTIEIVNLAKVAAAHGGVYASHMRNEGKNVANAINEALTIGKEANIPVQISHFKVAGKSNWGRSDETLNMVIQSRLDGYDVTIDQYPYTASSTNLAVTVPDWALSGGLDSLRSRIKSKAVREKIVGQMVKSLKNNKNKDYSYAVVAAYAPDTSLNGLNISEINKLKGRKANPKAEAETILVMLEKSNAQMIYHTMNEEDVKFFMRYPFNMPAADGGVSNGTGMPHPRGYGTNARVLGRYVREMKVIGIEEAVRRMTSLPAQKFNLHNRGLLQEGYAADMVIIDENTVSDVSTFQKPHQFSTGIPFVIVNGKLVIDNGVHTGVRSGTAIRN